MQNTYEHFDKQEIISLFQLSISPSLPPKSGMATDSNEHGKNQAETNSQKPSCKIPFTNPDILNRFEHNTNIPLLRYQNFISLFHMRPTLLGDHTVLHQDTMPKENNMTLARQGTYGGGNNNSLAYSYKEYYYTLSTCSSHNVVLWSFADPTRVKIKSGMGVEVMACSPPQVYIPPHTLNLWLHLLLVQLLSTCPTQYFIYDDKSPQLPLPSVSLVDMPQTTKTAASASPTSTSAGSKPKFALGGCFAPYAVLLVRLLRRRTHGMHMPGQGQEEEGVRAELICWAWPNGSRYELKS